jgi:hypothetical protein
MVFIEASIFASGREMNIKENGYDDVVFMGPASDR